MDAADITTPLFTDAIIEPTYDRLGHTLDLRQAVHRVESPSLIARSDPVNEFEIRPMTVRIVAQQVLAVSLDES
jgi:hypothetical protein